MTGKAHRCRWPGLPALLLLALVTGCGEAPGEGPPAIPAKTVVLTFDDAQRTHLTFVAPLLREYGFGGTFFVTERWMDDLEHYLSWTEVAELHGMGFEIGNHTNGHFGLEIPEAAGFMPGEMQRVEASLAAEGVPKPVSFAWPGGAFGPEGLKVLRGSRYRFARRCMQPEIPLARIPWAAGPPYDPRRHDRFLVPTTGEARAPWTMEHFRMLVGMAVEGRAAILTFHGVPDETNPDLSVTEAAFRRYMDYLKDNGFHVIAMRDLWPHVKGLPDPNDPLARIRHPDN